MNERCPVCDKKYSKNVVKCKICGFADELGINRIWVIAEDAEKWLKTTVIPYRLKWHEEIEETKTYQVMFNVTGGNGYLTAAVDSTNISSKANVTQKKSIEFTAKPNSDYIVKEWKVNNTIVYGNKTNYYNHANLSAPIHVTIEFEQIPVQIYPLTFNVKGTGGHLTAAVDGVNISSGVVLQRKQIEFTAKPNSGYRVKNWEINNKVVSGNQTNYCNIAKLSDPLNVTVEFEKIPEPVKQFSENFCGRCGKKFEPSEKFCGKCGYKRS